ncbi:MAG: flagellar basal-body MS-ring/collar protein FliF [Actinomycetota bacterium]|nr:flagellar basal-body MS-ring/collar protein FliF [Actinomycetota bacterium]
MQGLLDWLRRVSGRYTTAQKVGTLLVAVILILGLVMAARWASRPRYRVLFSGLEGEEVSKVLAKLDEQKVDYRVEGSAILVPQDQVDKLRLELSMEGVPSGGKVGYEVFDSTGFGASEFSQKVNYQRALEGELSRTISSLEQVEAADVHIVLPEEGIFTSGDRKASASVLVKLKPGQKLSSGQVEGVRNLVAGAVMGLSPEDVAVVDEAGNTLTGGESSMAQAATQLEALQAYRSYFESSLQEVVDRVVGRGKGIVKAHVSVDFSQSVTQEESYRPSTEGGLPKSQQTFEEVYNNGVGTATGVPGTGSNIPDYQSLTQGSSGAAYQKRETKTEYENNREVTEKTSPPGKITGVSLAVLVDQGVDHATVTALEEALSAAAGIDPGRGDVIAVQQVPFDTAQQEEARAALAKAEGGRRLMEWARLGGLVLLVALFAFFLLRRLKRVKKRLAELPMLDVTASQALEEAVEKARPMLTGTTKSPVLASIEMFANQRPDEVAKVLRAMLKER